MKNSNILDTVTPHPESDVAYFLAETGLSLVLTIEPGKSATWRGVFRRQNGAEFSGFMRSCRSAADFMGQMCCHCTGAQSVPQYVAKMEDEGETVDEKLIEEAGKTVPLNRAAKAFFTVKEIALMKELRF
jgi:hypothetical protein